MEVLYNAYVQLDPAVQNLISLGVTALVTFLLLQLAQTVPWLAEYLGQYKVGIVTWLTALIVQLIQAGLDKIPLEWDGVVILVMKLIVEVVIVLIGFAAYRRAKLKGSKALLPS